MVSNANILPCCNGFMVLRKINESMKVLGEHVNTQSKCVVS